MTNNKVEDSLVFRDLIIRPKIPGILSTALVCINSEFNINFAPKNYLLIKSNAF